MHRNICSSAGVSSLRVAFATTIIAMAILASLGQASSMDGAIYSEETLDRIMPDQETPLDALGYLGGLFEARFYQPHFTTDDPRDEIRGRDEAGKIIPIDARRSLGRLAR